MAGQVAVAPRLGDGFFGTQRAVVQAAEERCQARADPRDRSQQRLGLGGAASVAKWACTSISGSLRTAEAPWSLMAISQ